jgi:hypothetical protein
MRRIVLVAMIGVIACCASAEQKLRLPSVRQVDYVIESLSNGQLTRQLEFLYFLYVGNEETERADRLAEKSQITVNVSLVHPVPGAGSAVRTNARERWYFTQTDSRRCIARTGPVFEKAVWSFIPLLARHVLLALGPSDDDLILISWNGISGSLSVFFSPLVQKDRAFHTTKLAVIEEYFKTHRCEEDVPFSSPEPGSSACDPGASPWG